MATERFADRILKHVAGKGYQPKKIRRLAREMGIAESEYGDFRTTVKALAKSGRLVLGSSSAVTLPDPTGTIVGHYRANPRGFGFVIPDSPTSHGDLYIPQGETQGAMTGDIVSARVSRRKDRGGKAIFEGRILRIIERAHSRFVGELCRELDRWFVRPDGGTLHAPIFISDAKAKGSKAGDQVVVEIVQYPDERHDARGVIVELLGKRGDPGVDTISMIRQYQLPHEFPDPVLDAARRQIDEYDAEAEAAVREDLRDLTVITIDPDDARDFDDAISVRRVEGGVELGVHIADVSHFVEPGSQLDEEARERANSVYFPRMVLPMLPEVLSNGVCSLQEGEPRLTKSAFITYNRNGERLKSRFANTVIHSNQRLTYREATGILEGNAEDFPKDVVSLLRRMNTLAKSIRKRRLREGMLVLDIPEVELVFDDQGAATGVEPTDTSFSHTIIEMFMVEANEVVAELFADLNVPAIRRIHPPPDEAAAEGLTRFFAALGLPPIRSMERENLQKVLKKVRGKTESFAVNMAILRSMQQAVYSPKLDEHFALASGHYLHFTSPIRRYPDLTAHRLLDEYLNGRLTKRRRKDLNLPTEEQLEELGEHCSENERRAEAAERELKQVLILRLLEKDLGKTYQGVVTGVANFGLFIQLDQYLIEGLLRFEDLPNDWWEVDTAAGCVVGQRTGQQIKIGDKMKVATAGVDLAGRKLELALPNDEYLRDPPSKARQPRRKAATRKGPRRPKKTRRRRR